MPSTGKLDIRDCPLIGHAADISKSTRMTRSGHCGRQRLVARPFFDPPSERRERGCKVLKRSRTVDRAFSAGGSMRRREFTLRLLAVRVASWPLTARGQQSERVRRIGRGLLGQAIDDQQGQRFVIAALLKALRRHGHGMSGRNVRMDVAQGGAGNAQEINRIRLHRELGRVFDCTDVIVRRQGVRSEPVGAAFRKRTDERCSCFCGDGFAMDSPVAGSGFVDSAVARPAASATGFSSDLRVRYGREAMAGAIEGNFRRPSIKASGCGCETRWCANLTAGAGQFGATPICSFDTNRGLRSFGSMAVMMSAILSGKLSGPFLTSHDCRTAAWS